MAYNQYAASVVASICRQVRIKFFLDNDPTVSADTKSVSHCIGMSYVPHSVMHPKRISTPIQVSLRHYTFVGLGMAVWRWVWEPSLSEISPRVQLPLEKNALGFSHPKATKALGIPRRQGGLSPPLPYRCTTADRALHNPPRNMYPWGGPPQAHGPSGGGSFLASLCGLAASSSPGHCWCLGRPTRPRSICPTPSPLCRISRNLLSQQIRP